MIRSDRNEIVSRARALRRTMSLPERMLWARLRQRPAGLKFRRQHPLGPYVADFYCSAARVVFEIDGAGHGEAGRIEHDGRRDAWMKAQGIRVVRIPAEDVLRDVDEIAERIVRYVSRVLPLHQASLGSPPH